MEHQKRCLEVFFFLRVWVVICFKVSCDNGHYAKCSISLLLDSRSNGVGDWSHLEDFTLKDVQNSLGENTDKMKQADRLFQRTDEAVSRF